MCQHGCCMTTARQLALQQGQIAKNHQEMETINMEALKVLRMMHFKSTKLAIKSQLIRNRTCIRNGNKTLKSY